MRAPVVAQLFYNFPYQLIAVPSSEGEKAQLLGALQLSELIPSL